MLSDTANALLSLLVFASGAACIGADYAGQQARVYVFKPLTMLLVLALALQPSTSTNALYQWTLVAGLLFSLAGDVFLMLPSDRFVAGLASFLSESIRNECLRTCRQQSKGLRDPVASHVVRPSAGRIRPPTCVGAHHRTDRKACWPGRQLEGGK